MPETLLLNEPRFAVDEVSPSTRYRRVPFNMHCDANVVYLAIASEDGSARQIHQMEHAGGDRWSLTVRLMPGRYRYRYYSDHATVTTYVRANEVDDKPVKMDGFDAVLEVPASLRLGATGSTHLAHCRVRPIENIDMN
jgi:hypothetical protein